MKKYKTMIILLAVFVALFGLYFLMSYINKVQTEKEQDETIMLTMIDELVSMEYTDGTTTISFVKEDDAWKLSGDEETQLDYDLVEDIAGTLCQIETTRVLEGAEELSEYGLEESMYTITLVEEDGTKTVIYIGDSIDDKYYATMGDKTVVCVINSSVVEILQFDVATLEAEE